MTLDSYMYQRSIQMRLEIYHMNPQSTVERLTFRRYQSLMFISKCHCGRQQTHQGQLQCSNLQLYHTVQLNLLS